jgi:hypothetical protein
MGHVSGYIARSDLVGAVDVFRVNSDAHQKLNHFLFSAYVDAL